ncbi:MBL fold metallo-hydrolase [Aneurinibacillus terranovensis]|uniref:MBL fold metallo-hydrolase n=1 Tax=Aneurinibacillus terranovensis TaxID=278991 RepID=UPI00040E3271|nr:MBL fold metallo-hydrolase [Aneurinibacillus terranovensis]
MNKVKTDLLSLRIPTPFSVGPVNVYLIKGETVTLVDAGPKTREAWHLLDEFIKRAGLDWHDVDQLFLTHPHVDHSGLVGEILHRADVNVIAHPHAVPYMELTKDFMYYHDHYFRQFYLEHGVPDALLRAVDEFRSSMNTYTESAPVHHAMEGGAELPGNPEWTVVFTPGHTQNHLSLYREKDGIMLVGDFLIKEVPANAFIEPPFDPKGERARPILVYRKAMQEIFRLPVTRMYSGHGEEITDYRSLITSRLNRNWTRAERLVQFLQEGEKTAFQLSAEIFPKIYQTQLPLTMSDTVGHLDLLEESGRVSVRKQGGQNVYRLV